MSNNGAATASGLRDFLDARGVRYIWVAGRLGITPSHLNRLMSRERPLTPKNAAKLAEIFGVPASTFTGGPS